MGRKKKGEDCDWTPSGSDSDSEDEFLEPLAAVLPEAQDQSQALSESPTDSTGPADSIFAARAPQTPASRPAPGDESMSESENELHEAEGDDQDFYDAEDSTSESSPEAQPVEVRPVLPRDSETINLQCTPARLEATPGAVHTLPVCAPGLRKSCRGCDWHNQHCSRREEDCLEFSRGL